MNMLAWNIERALVNVFVLQRASVRAPETAEINIEEPL